jgi:hypothetical protein
MRSSTITKHAWPCGGAVRRGGRATIALFACSGDVGARRHAAEWFDVFRHVMDTESRTVIVHRMHLLLRRELGQGIDEARTLADPLYARDVLLVCDAMHGSELPGLAAHYRRVATLPAARPADADELRADADPPTPRGAGGGAAPPARRWLSPARWLARP